MFARIQWPTAAILIAALVLIAAAYLFGPRLGVSPDAQKMLVGGIGAVGAIVLAIMRGVLSRDDDHDGIPDAIENTPTDNPSKRPPIVPPGAP